MRTKRKDIRWESSKVERLLLKNHAITLYLDKKYTRWHHFRHQERSGHIIPNSLTLGICLTTYRTNLQTFNYKKIAGSIRKLALEFHKVKSYIKKRYRRLEMIFRNRSQMYPKKLTLIFLTKIFAKMRKLGMK